MPKCENCIHCEVCKRYLMSTDITPEELNKIGKREQTKQCEFFKDKSLIVELPCKVGDSVYVCLSDSPTQNRILRFETLSVELVYQAKRAYYLAFEENNELPFIHIDLKSFGKTVFLTREEAEKALREREK